MVLGMVSLAVQSSLPLHILLLAPLFRFDRRWFAVVSWWPIVLLARRFPPLPPQAVSQSLQAFAQERRRGLAVGPDVSSGSRALGAAVSEVCSDDEVAGEVTIFAAEILMGECDYTAVF